MASNLNIIHFYTEVTKKWEKGKVNHPADPGGVTNDGVATHFITSLARTENGNEFLRSIGIEPKFIMGFINKQAKVKAEIFDPAVLLQFTPDQCRDILLYAFWFKNGLRNVPCKLTAFATFDFSVNSGAARARKYLQGTINVTAKELGLSIPRLAEDGIIGPATMSALKQFEPIHFDRSLALAICERRLSFLRSLNTWPTFGRGWFNRVQDIKNYINRVYEGAK